MRNVLLVFALFATLVAMPNVAQASLQAGDTIRFVDGPGSGPGGEFIVDVFDGSWTNDVFRTFCIERNEFIAFDNDRNGTPKYTVDSVLGVAVKGGEGGQDGVQPNGLTHDSLSASSAWLFYEFTKGTLAGYDYGAGRVASANELQNAFWELEDETHNGSGAAFVALANGVADKSVAVASVRVINPITYGDTPGDKDARHHQSMLYVIPEPISIAVWGGLIAAVALRRRRRQI